MQPPIVSGLTQPSGQAGNLLAMLLSATGKRRPGSKGARHEPPPETGAPKQTPLVGGSNLKSPT